MIRIAVRSCPTTPAWHEPFLRMLPAIREHVRIAFRNLDPDAKAECVQNAICNACAAVARLAELGKLDLCYASVLARYAVAQTRDGRMVGGHLNCKDISSAYCQRRTGVVMERLDKFDTEEDSWQEILVEDRRAGPPEVARVRLDFASWLRRLSRRNRRIARFLALGNRTSDAARKFGLSEGRISQVRDELSKSWRIFIGEEPGKAYAAAASA